jgi:zinc D-Ala-D-Ala carboxypeptidase
MQLSRHFTLSELTISETAARKGLNNVPPAKELANLARLAGVLEQVRALVNRPIVVTSGYRSKAVNKAIGGSTTSAHMSGLAADINCPPLTAKQFAQKINASGVQFDQLILEFPDGAGGGWVHIGLSEGPPRRQTLTIRKGTGYVEGIV